MELRRAIRRPKLLLLIPPCRGRHPHSKHVRLYWVCQSFERRRAAFVQHGVSPGGEDRGLCDLFDGAIEADRSAGALFHLLLRDAGCEFDNFKSGWGHVENA